ncbi:similar to Saccharomyces cerevisiae YNL292W PUS4 Pseudouridine synthase [Maudiozyma saulgeensis]|uniref:tRNA pseudouridine(55) synthase n=1 Tax=Maudiozyma saulgeensis TaxID=1789683 RepID=A0A1X7R201_9SACH|nr:similar to Saccharomyces cerevisiae YNL292W PUS4 Pseudouridine synthase [Kazachstania saulgeensis]
MNGIFAIEKPSGITSNQFMMKLQRLLNNSQIFSKEIARATAERMQQYQQQTGKKASKRKLRKVSKVKMGHGGTLDPLASGVLVIGIGSGTKQLSNYLGGTVKVYESEALFGVSTTSGDVEGEILAENSVKHLNKENLLGLKEKFEGSLKQTPPIFAALKMDGKPLHQYAREGKPLPRAIEPRQVTIYDMKFFPDCLSTEHNYPLLRPPTDDAKETIKLLNANLKDDKLYFSKEYCDKQGWDTQDARVEDPIPLTEEELKTIEEKADTYRAPLLHFRAKVSSGTYIRSLISDVGKAMRSSSYMVKLIRLQQEKWSLEEGNVFKFEDFNERDEKVWSKVLQKVIDLGPEVKIADEIQQAQLEFDNEKKASEESYTNDVNENNPESVEKPKTEENVEEIGNSKKRSADEL